MWQAEWKKKKFVTFGYGYLVLRDVFISGFSTWPLVWTVTFRSRRERKGTSDFGHRDQLRPLCHLCVI